MVNASGEEVDSIKVEFHLASILSCEVAELDFDGNEAFQAAVVEEGIEVEVIRVDLDAHPYSLPRSFEAEQSKSAA